MTNLPVPAPTTAAPGNFLTSALWNAQVRDAVNFLLNPPIFAGYQSVAGSIGVSPVVVAMDSETQDTYGGHSNTTNTSRYVAQVAGVYKVWGALAWGGQTSQTEMIGYIAKNGTEVTGSRVTVVANSAHTYSLGTSPVFVPMIVGDYVELFGQSDVAATGLHAGTGQTSALNVQFIHV